MVKNCNNKKTIATMNGLMLQIFRCASFSLRKSYQIFFGCRLHNNKYFVFAQIETNVDELLK